jgi:hypothetical protein
MHRLAVLACLLIAGIGLSISSAAAKKLPASVSLQELTELLKRAAGPDVMVGQGIGGFVAKVRGIDVGWIEGTMDGRTGEALVGEAISLMKIACDESSFQLSAVTRQLLDGVRLLRQSFSCRVFGPITPVQRGAGPRGRRPVPNRLQWRARRAARRHCQGRR